MRIIKMLIAAVLIAVLPATANAACSDGAIAKDTELLHGTSFIPLTDRMGKTSATPREPAWFADTSHREFAIHAGARWAKSTATEMNVYHYTTNGALAVRTCTDRDEFIADQLKADKTFKFDSGDEDRDIAKHFCAATTSFQGYQLNEDAVRDEPEYILCAPATDLKAGAVDKLPLKVSGDTITVTDGSSVYELDLKTLGFKKIK